MLLRLSCFCLLSNAWDTRLRLSLLHVWVANLLTLFTQATSAASASPVFLEFSFENPHKYERFTCIIYAACNLFLVKTDNHVPCVRERGDGGSARQAAA